MKREFRIVRSMHVEGSHLYGCFIDPKVRQIGWKKMQAAKRIARRLGYALQAIVAVLLLCAVQASATPPMPAGFEQRMADAIWIAEGGSKTRWPYGVKSVKVSSVAEARRVTVNSVRNNWVRWHAAGKPEPFVQFMARRWCPPSADPVGHRNWVKNVNYSLKRG